MSTFEQKLFHALRPKRRRGGTRRGPWRSESKRRFVAGMLCCNCWKSGCQAAHIRNNGMSSKCSDEFIVNLCCDCHDQFDGRVKLPNGKTGGHAAFQRYYKIDLAEYAAGLHSAWLATERPGHECECRFSGDRADASDCPLHGVSKPPAVRLVMEESNGDSIPF